MAQVNPQAPVVAHPATERKQFGSELFQAAPAAAVRLVQTKLAEPEPTTIRQLSLPFQPSQPPNRFTAAELPPADLQFRSVDIIVCAAKAQPKRRQKGRKSMKRQNGTLSPALRDFVDACLVPILVEKYLAENRAAETEAS